MFNLKSKITNLKSGRLFGLWHFSQSDRLVEHALCNFPLGGFGHFDHFAVSDDGDRIAVRVEAHAFA